MFAVQTAVGINFVFGLSAAGVYKQQLRKINELKFAISQEIAAVRLDY